MLRRPKSATGHGRSRQLHLTRPNKVRPVTVPDPGLCSPLNSQEAEMNALLNEVHVQPYVTHVPESVYRPV